MEARLIAKALFYPRDDSVFIALFNKIGNAEEVGRLLGVKGDTIRGRLSRVRARYGDWVRPTRPGRRPKTVAA